MEKDRYTDTECYLERLEDTFLIKEKKRKSMRSNDGAN